MMVRLLITEWERVKERFNPIELKQKKVNVRQYAIPLYKGQNYPRFHLHVTKKSKIWMEVWVHLDWKRHNKWETFNAQLVDFIHKLQQV